MNDIIQNILVFTAMVLSIIFLVKKFVWKKTATANTKKACGNDGCGCH